VPAHIQASKRVLASRQNGRLGGLKTAQTHSAEFLEDRASKAGTSTRDTYGSGYYSFIASQTRKPSNKPKELIQQITNSVSEPANTAELMDCAAKQLEKIQM
jgi:hypothetical protein